MLEKSLILSKFISLVLDNTLIFIFFINFSSYLRGGTAGGD